MSNPLLRMPAEEMGKEHNRYQTLGFTGNPFPVEPALAIGSQDPRLNGSIYYAELHEGKQAHFDSFLVPTPSRDQTRSIVFLMDHASMRGRGIGKTAFLKHQQDRIMADLGATASDDSAVVFAAHISPTTSPSCRKFWQFCRTIAETLADQDIIAHAVCRLRAFSGLISGNLLQDIGDDPDLRSTLGNDQWLIQQGINIMFDLNPAVQRTLEENGVRGDLANLLAREGCNPDAFKQNFRRIYTDYVWRKDGGRLVFDDFVKVFAAANFTRGLLLVDEAEKIIFHQNNYERRSFVESLRYYMFDGGCANTHRRFFGMLLTIHPVIQEMLLPSWGAAGLDRLAPIAEPDAQQCTVYFPPLDGQMAVPLVTTYLDYFRLDASKRGRIEPFTEEALLEALVKSGGVPGPMLSLLHRVVDHVVDNEVETIDKDLVVAVYNAPGRVEAVEEPEEEVLPKHRVDLTREKGENGASKPANH